MAVSKNNSAYYETAEGDTPKTGPVVMMYCLLNLDGTADFTSGCSIGDQGSASDYHSIGTDEISGVFHAEVRSVDSGEAVAQSSTSVAKDIWISVIGVFTAPNDRDVYLNGTGSASNFTLKTPDNVDAVFIGAAASSALAFDGPCRIAEVAMWDTVLDSGQAIILGAGPPFRSPLLFKPGNLIFYNPLYTDAQALKPYIGGPMTKTGTIVDYPHPPVIKPAPKTFVFLPSSGVALEKIYDESLSVTETESRNDNRPYDESVVVTETDARERGRVLDESVVVTETDAREKGRVLDESLIITETDAREKGRVFDESLAVTETESRQDNRSLDESLTITETDSRQDNRVLDESLALTETDARERGRVLDESLALTETESAAHARSETEALALTETDSVAIVFAKLLNESLALTETEARERGRVLDESLALTESDAQAIIQTGIVDESLIITESVSRQDNRPFDESIAVAESISAALNRLIDESLALTETTAREKGRVLDESLTTSETISRQDNRPYDESLTTTETISRQDNRPLDESVTITESLVKTIIVVGDLEKVYSEALAVNETTARAFGRARIFTESIDVTELFNPEHLRVLDESLTVTETSAREHQRLENESLSINESTAQEIAPIGSGFTITGNVNRHDGSNPRTDRAISVQAFETSDPINPIATDTPSASGDYTLSIPFSPFTGQVIVLCEDAFTSPGAYNYVNAGTNQVSQDFILMYNFFLTDSGGNNAGPGTSGNPMSTINTAYLRCKPGDGVIFEAGTWNQTLANMPLSGAVNFPIRFIGQIGTTIVNSQGFNHSFRLFAGSNGVQISYFFFSGIIFQNSGGNVIESINSSHWDMEDCVTRGCNRFGVRLSGFSAEGSHHINILRHKTYDNGAGLDGAGVRVGGRTFGDGYAHDINMTEVVSHNNNANPATGNGRTGSGFNINAPQDPPMGVPGDFTFNIVCFRCAAWNNGSTGFGDQLPDNVVYEECIAISNNRANQPDGEGGGWRIGVGDGDIRKIIKFIAFDNRDSGIQIHNTGSNIEIHHGTMWGNGYGNEDGGKDDNIRYENGALPCNISNVVAFDSPAGDDFHYTGSPTSSHHNSSGDGTGSHANSISGGGAEMFVGPVPTDGAAIGLSQWDGQTGGLTPGNDDADYWFVHDALLPLMTPITGSVLIDAGATTGFEPNHSGTPDIGWFQSGVLGGTAFQKFFDDSLGINESFSRVITGPGDTVGGGVTWVSNEELSKLAQGNRCRAWMPNAVNTLPYFRNWMIAGMFFFPYMDHHQLQNGAAVDNQTRSYVAQGRRTDAMFEIVGSAPLFEQQMRAGFFHTPDFSGAIAIAITESLAINEPVSRQDNRSQEDALAITEVFAHLRGIVGIFTESVTLNETLPIQHLRTFLELLRITDTAVDVLALRRLITESVVINESPVFNRGVFLSLAETLNLTETTDQTGLAQLALVYTESLDLTESFARVFGLQRILDESLVVNEVLVPQWLLRNLVLDESLTIVEENQIGHQRSVEDTITIVDSFLTSVGFERVLTESLIITESANEAKTSVVDFFDTVRFTCYIRRTDSKIVFIRRSWEKDFER